MKQIFHQIEQYIPHLGKKNESVSKASVGWHLDHALKAMVVMRMGLEQSNPAEYHPKFNFKKWVVFTTGNIPRGKAKAPQASQPDEENLSEDLLRKHLQKAKEKLMEWDQLDANQYINHHVFGHLNVKNTQKMIKIHSNHHLKIVNKILNQ